TWASRSAIGVPMAPRPAKPIRMSHSVWRGFRKIPDVSSTEAGDDGRAYRGLDWWTEPPAVSRQAQEPNIMRHASRTPLVPALLTSLFVLAAACSGRDDLVQPPESSPLAGLTEAPALDSTGTTLPGPSGSVQSGDISGTVVGPSPVGSTGVTIAAAPLVAGVEY